MEDNGNELIVNIIKACFSKAFDEKSHYQFQLFKRRLYENHDFGSLRPVHPGECLGI